MFIKGNMPIRRSCQHVIKHSTPIISVSNSTTQEDSAIASHTLVKQCNGIALRGQDYCRYHIRLYKPNYIATSRADKDDTLSLLLTKLINKTGAYDSKDTRTIIALLRKSIDTHRTERKVFTPDKLNTLLDRIADIIKTHITDSEKVRAIALDFNRVAQEYSALRE